MSNPAAAVELRPGSRFGGYRIEAAVGRGGMATVYRAEHLHLRRQVALKVPMAELAEEPAFRERFIRESRAAATLVHPNLVTVFDAGEIDGVLYLAMQFVEGEDLARRLKRDGPLAPGRAIAVLAQIAAALDAAHDRGLIHRDVKPANVLVEGDRCFIADFGLTKLSGATAATMTGDLLGTLSYAPPEQIEGAGVDRRTDVYALGATAYECLVGMTPFAHRSGAALLYAHLTEPPPRASDSRPALPAAVDVVLARALAKSPPDRYATCGEFVAALEDALSAAPTAVPVAKVARETRIPFPLALERCRAFPLAGRERQLALLDNRPAGRRVVVALAGEPGIGKTRLAAELAAQAHADGATVFYGRAQEDSVIPYEAFVEGLRHLCAHVDVSRLPAEARALAPLVPELAQLGAPTPTPDAGADRYRMFEGVAKVLAYAGRSAPVVLVLDDLQWAEKADLLLLRHVIESVQPSALAAIVTYRPLWVGSDHPLRDTLADLGRRHDLHQAELAGLNEQEIARLAAGRLGADPSRELTAALFARTSGNPLFVEELLRDASADDPAATTTALPQNVHHIVRRRLQRLTPATRDVLVTAALMRDDFSRATLAAVAADDAEDALEEGLAAHVLIEQDGRFALAHSLIRDVLVEDAPGPERRRRHLQIARALERRGAEPAILARHFLAARATGPALSWSIVAAREASRRHGHEQAAALLTKVQELVDERDDVDLADRRTLLLELGQARLRASQPRCLETFGAAAELARITDDAEALAEAALGLAGRVIDLIGDADHAQTLEEALAALPPVDSPLRVRVLACLAQTAPDARALELSGDAMAMAERLGGDDARLAALAGRHAALRDEPNDRAAVGSEWVALADRTGELEAAALARHWFVLDLLEAGDRPAAQRELLLLAALADRLHQPLYDYCVLLWRAVLARLDGCNDDAETSAAVAIAERMRVPDPGRRLAAQIEGFLGCVRLTASCRESEVSVHSGTHRRGWGLPAT